MKKRMVLMLFLFLFLFLEPLSTAAPYWLKPGSQIVYFANGTTNPNAYGGGAYYQWNGCIANLGFQSMRLVFRVVNVSKGWATINVTLILYGDKSLKWPFSDVYAYYPSTCNPPFPNPLNTTPYTRSNVSLKWSDYGTRLILHGAYRIHLPTGLVYAMDGKSYGHTLLFGLYPVSNDTYVVLGSKRLYFNNVRVLNSTTYITYYRNFTGPNILVLGEPVNFTDPSGASAFLRTMTVFNPGQDISLGFLGVCPDLEAAFGISAFIEGDRMAIQLKPQFSGGKLEKVVAPGVILYDFDFPKTQSSITQRPLQLATAPSLSGLWTLLTIAGLLLLMTVFLLRRR